MSLPRVRLNIFPCILSIIAVVLTACHSENGDKETALSDQSLVTQTEGEGDIAEIAVRQKPILRREIITNGNLNPNIPENPIVLWDAWYLKPAKKEWCLLPDVVAIEAPVLRLNFKKKSKTGEFLPFEIKESIVYELAEDEEPTKRITRGGVNFVRAPSGAKSVSFELSVEGKEKRRGCSLFFGRKYFFQVNHKEPVGIRNGRSPAGRGSFYLTIPDSLEKNQILDVDIDVDATQDENQSWYIDYKTVTVSLKDDFLSENNTFYTYRVIEVEGKKNLLVTGPVKGKQFSFELSRIGDEFAIAYEKENSILYYKDVMIQNMSFPEDADYSMPPAQRESIKVRLPNIDDIEIPGRFVLLLDTSDLIPIAKDSLVKKQPYVSFSCMPGIYYMGYYKHHGDPFQILGKVTVSKGDSGKLIALLPID